MEILTLTFMGYNAKNQAMFISDDNENFIDVSSRYQIDGDLSGLCTETESGLIPVADYVDIVVIH